MATAALAPRAPRRRRRRSGYNGLEVLVIAIACLTAGAVAALTWSLLRGDPVQDDGSAAAVLGRAGAAFPEAYAERAAVTYVNGPDGVLRPQTVAFYLPARLFAEDLAPRVGLPGDFNDLGAPFAVGAEINRAEMNARASALARSMAADRGGVCADYVIDDPRLMAVPAWPDRTARRVRITLDYEC